MSVHKISAGQHRRVCMLELTRPGMNICGRRFGARTNDYAPVMAEQTFADTRKPPVLAGKMLTKTYGRCEMPKCMTDPDSRVSADSCLCQDEPGQSCSVMWE